MKLEKELEGSEQLMIEIHKQFDGVDLPDGASLQTKIAAALFHLCIEHHQGIHILLGQNVGGSALALLRPQFESYIRGLWIGCRATGPQLQRFLEDKGMPTINDMLDAIKKEPDFDATALLALKRAIWSRFSDMTHGGSFQVSIRVSPVGIGSNYPAGYVAAALRHATHLAHLAALGLADLATRPDLSHALTSMRMAWLANAEN